MFPIILFAIKIATQSIKGWLTTSGCNVMPEWYAILIRSSFVFFFIKGPRKIHKDQRPDQIRSFLEIVVINLSIITSLSLETIR